MLVWFLYDIVDNKRRNKVIKMAKEYGLSRVQKSVFLGNITKNRIDEITLQSERIINLKTDSLYIMPMCQADYKEIVLLGNAFDQRFVNDEINTLIL